MTNFLAIWTYEEFKHRGLKAYLEAAEAGARLLTAELATTRAGEWLIPDRYTDLMMSTYAMLQELITGIFYKNFALKVREPVLRCCSGRSARTSIVTASSTSTTPSGSSTRTARGWTKWIWPCSSSRCPAPVSCPTTRTTPRPCSRRPIRARLRFREVLTKVSNLIGKRHMLRLASNGDYRRQLKEAWGIEPRHLFAFS